jgi:hypothetical protein
MAPSVLLALLLAAAVGSGWGFKAEEFKVCNTGAPSSHRTINPIR